MRPRRSRHAPFLALLAAPLALACGGSDEDASEDPGALVRITAKSRVGVLLDELPTDIRDRVAADLLARPEAFFIDRAKRQLALATYRLNFRAAFYDEDSGKHQLPLPPDSVLRVSLVPGENGAHARREQVEGHDYVLADYEIESVAVTAAASPGETEPALAAVDGTWAEPFTFPVDPELLVQRTGYACMDEAEFPRNSVTTENPDFFYDQECEVETELSLDGCHGTALPTESCQDALAAHVGRVDTALEYERIAWDEALADQYRVGEVRSPGASDLEVVTAELEVNQLVYRYVESDS
ncbi:MAG: hypothetical protein FJ104_01940, partial [Deltaproteobacteria bacterium]|nr:hypothetical protein [Deltaproteobacteria bacterium]